MCELWTGANCEVLAKTCHKTAYIVAHNLWQHRPTHVFSVHGSNWQRERDGSSSDIVTPRFWRTNKTNQSDVFQTISDINSWYSQSMSLSRSDPNTSKLLSSTPKKHQNCHRPWDFRMGDDFRSEGSAIIWALQSLAKLKCAGDLAHFLVINSNSNFMQKSKHNPSTCGARKSTRLCGSGGSSP